MAAVDLEAVPMVPSEPDLLRLRDFHEHDVTIDTTVSPLVSVTFASVDTDTYRDAVAKASRIEGLVVVALERYRVADDCRDANDMTWRIPP